MRDFLDFVEERSISTEERAFVARTETWCRIVSALREQLPTCTSKIRTAPTRSEAESRSESGPYCVCVMPCGKEE